MNGYRMALIIVGGFLVGLLIGEAMASFHPGERLVATGNGPGAFRGGRTGD